MLDIFGDGRKVPRITVNIKVKISNLDEAETKAWNKAFGYVMKKQHSKLEFLALNIIRDLSLKKLTLSDIKPFISDSDYEALSNVEDIFNTKISSDIKAFIIAMLKVPVPSLVNLLKS